MTPIIVIAGPTATHKSRLAIELAKHINGVIINGDSRQIYKELKIATAQPIPEKIINNTWYIEDIPHYLYGFISITQVYNLYKYQQQVYRLLQTLTKPVILVGGTGLYIDAVVHGYKLTNNTNIIKRHELRNLSVNKLQSLIQPDILGKLNNSDKNNPYRLIRIIEQGEINRKKSPIKHLYLITQTGDPEKYNKRLKYRIDQMFKQGLVQEIQSLYETYPNLWNYPALNTIGYKEFKNSLGTREIYLQDIKQEILKHTKQYSKRQKIWFKRNSDAKYVNDINKIKTYAENFLNTF